MMTKLQRWGNSQAIRIPKALLDGMQLQENDDLDVVKDGDRIIIKKVWPSLSYKERMQGYSGNYKSAEWDTGYPQGREIL